MFVVGDRVRNVSPQNSAVPFDCLGTVVEGPNCTYGVTVQWDGLEMFDSHGERGWRPYWATTELRHVDPRKHAVYDPCHNCGKNHPVLTGPPDRVMGGMLVFGAEVIECGDCGRRLFYKSRSPLSK